MTFQKVTEGHTSNIVISPFSIHMSVSLAYMGASGKTADEMRTGLKLSGTKQKNSEEIRQLLKPIQKSKMFKVANKVYVMENTHSVKKEFHTIAKKRFYSKAQMLDFHRGTESAGTINKWVEHKTNNKIRNVISPNSL